MQCVCHFLEHLCIWFLHMAVFFFWVGFSISLFLSLSLSLSSLCMFISFTCSCCWLADLSFLAGQKGPEDGTPDGLMDLL